MKLPDVGSKCLLASQGCHVSSPQTSHRVVSATRSILLSLTYLTLDCLSSLYNTEHVEDQDYMDEVSSPVIKSVEFSAPALGMYLLEKVSE